MPFFKKKNKNKEKKEKGDQNSEEGQVEIKKEVGGRIKDNVIIHTMPKKFLKLQEKASDSSKGLGLVILFGGVLLLIVVSGVLYFYLFKSKPEIVEPPVEVEPVEVSEPVKGEEEEKENKKEPIKVIEEPVVATSTEEELATSTEEVATTTVPVVEVAPPVVEKVIDSDNDGLSDIEESLLGTGVSKVDTDGDSYNDLSEMINLFNPAGEGKIEMNDNVEVYRNSSYKYALYYFKQWGVKSIQDDESIIFQVEPRQFIQIIVQKNLKMVSLQDWYKEQFEVSAIKSSQIIYKKGWSAIQNLDGSVIYLSNPGSEYIFTFMRNVGKSYDNVVEMIFKSLEITK